MVQLVRFGALAPGAVHGFSTRANGNMGMKHGKPQDVAHFRELFLRLVDPRLTMERAVCMAPLSPGYEETVAYISAEHAGAGMHSSAGGVRAEAMITEERGIALFLPVADCIPIIIYEPKAGVLALVHGGRESSVRTIAQKTITVMEEFCRADPRRMVAALGPGIGASYEIDDFKQRDAPQWRGFWEIRPNGKTHVDLIGFNRKLLEACGIRKDRIVVSGFDTGADIRFFSHQRSRLSGDPEGRNAAVVAMI